LEPLLAAEGWGGRAWAGVALYLVLFAAAVLGTWVLVRGAPGGEDRR
jgi:hypothetical protein